MQLRVELLPATHPRGRCALTSSAPFLVSVSRGAALSASLPSGSRSDGMHAQAEELCLGILQKPMRAEKNCA